MKKILFVFMASAFLFACKGKTGWSAAEKKAFVDNCVSSGSSLGDKASSYCNCMVEKVSAQYPNPSDASKLKAEDMMDWAKECLK